MTLKNAILKYAGILNEDRPSAYAKRLYDDLVSKNLQQTNLDNVSFINFNKNRIEQAIKTKDFKIFECNSLQDFYSKVINWFVDHHYFREQDRNFLIRASTDYYNQFIALQ